MKENFGRLKAFLKRDIRSFFNSSAESEQPLIPPIVSQEEAITQSASEISNTEPEPEPEPVPIPPLPLLLNPAALDRVAFRREILDWRDNSILQLGVAANAVLKEFSVHVVTLLDDVPFWRRALPKAANEVLTVDFNTRVRLRIQDRTKKYDHQLDEIMGRWERNKASRLRLIDEWPDSQLSYVANLGFKPSNQEDILEAISFLVLGPHGVADKFYQQISRISARITEEA